MPKPWVLYISYNSLIEPLSLTQIVPYIRELASDYSMTVLSFDIRGLQAEEYLDAKRWSPWGFAFT